MRQRFYTVRTAREQGRRVRRKKCRLAAVTAAVLALLTAVCLLQGRSTQTAAIVVNGLVSSAYLSYLLYFFPYDLKREKAGGRLAGQPRQGSTAAAHGTVAGGFRDRLRYDWPFYLLIICGCLFGWGSVFSAVNNYRPEEKLTVFLCVQGVDDSAQLQEMRAAVEEAGVVQLNMDCYDTSSDKYYTVLAVKGIYNSDVLILDEESTELFLSGGNALELSPAVLNDLLGDGREAELRRTADGRPAAIKIWDEAESTGFDLECLELGGGSGCYYLIINGKSVHAKPYAEGDTDAAIRLCRVLLGE